MMKHLTQKHLGELHVLLSAREQRLADEIADALERRQAQSFESREVDSEVFDLDNALCVANALRDEAEAEAVRAALGRIDRGTFGRCLGCGAGIPIERLRVQPEAALCHVCQSRAEDHVGHGLSAP